VTSFFEFIRIKYKNYVIYCCCLKIKNLFYRLRHLRQGCGSGLDPDSLTLLILIHIGDPDQGARKSEIDVEKMLLQLGSVY
jgi:hypothetical protein